MECFVIAKIDNNKKVVSDCAEKQFEKNDFLGAKLTLYSQDLTVLFL